MSNHPEDLEIALLTSDYKILDVPSKRVELDLGCGAGSYTVALAAKLPDAQIYGADVMIGRLRKLVSRSHRKGVTNIQALRIEARMLVARALPDNSIDRIHLLCPDPWPKDRHKGHRLLTSDFTTQLHRVLKPNGVFHFSSDDEAYVTAVEKILAESQLFQTAEPDAELAEVRSDFENRWLDMGKKVKHLWAKRLPLPEIKIGH